MTAEKDRRDARVMKWKGVIYTVVPEEDGPVDAPFVVSVMEDGHGLTRLESRLHPSELSRAELESLVERALYSVQVERWEWEGGNSRRPAAP